MIGVAVVPLIFWTFAFPYVPSDMGTWGIVFALLVMFGTWCRVFIDGNRSNAVVPGSGLCVIVAALTPLSAAVTLSAGSCDVVAHEVDDRRPGRAPSSSSSASLRGTPPP